MMLSVDEAKKEKSLFLYFAANIDNLRTSCFYGSFRTGCQYAGDLVLSLNLSFQPDITKSNSEKFHWLSLLLALIVSEKENERNSKMENTL